MVIYLVYRDGAVMTVTTLPRVVQDGFARGGDSVSLWRNDKLVRTYRSLKAFNAYVNPRPSEDDEEGGNDYEW